MISPSSSVTMRMIPCIAGCAGPMPTVRFWPVPVPLPSPSMNSRRVVVVAVLLGATSISDPRSDQRLTTVDRVVLAERVADELLVHEQPAKIQIGRASCRESVEVSVGDALLLKNE